MKNTKKNNKGFSLVELIVVVLIMAIIAVALAPQVMKWVNTSRESKDVNAVGSMLSLAKTEAVVAKGGVEAKIVIDENGVKYIADADGSATAALTAATDTFGKTLATSFGDMASYKCSSKGVFTIVIENNNAKCTSITGLVYGDALDLSGITPST